MEMPYFDVQHLQRYDKQKKGERPTFHLADRMSGFRDLISIFNKCTEKNPGSRPTAKKLVKMFAELA